MKLHESGCFRSLTYRDMPFILAPNCWHKVSRLFLQKKKLQQRAHRDGIKIGYDSPEAFEEIFWKTFYGSDFIKTDCLVPMDEKQDYSNTFKSFVFTRFEISYSWPKVSVKKQQYHFEDGLHCRDFSQVLFYPAVQGPGPAGMVA